ncbi:MAG: family transporter substrate-binding protein [Clostridia bacterium]|jgi:ribose transport system substrate-binding protein|nr:family transporter substrate-binding protein [Clostridia bacterium]
MKKPSKSALLLLFTLGLPLFFITGPAAQEAVPSEQIYIPVIAKTLDFGFFKQLRAGTEQAAKDYGIKTTFEGPLIGEPLEIQIDVLKSALTKNPQAILISALDATALTPYLEEAQRRGIPVVGVDTGVDSPIMKTTVGIDNYGAGELAGMKMGELLGGKGKVGVLSVSKPVKVSRERGDGFMNTIRENYSDIEIIPVTYSLDSRADAKEAAKKILETHPDITGLFGINALMNEGIIDALKELNKIGTVTVIAFDSGKTITDAIREGIIAGAITQDPVGMGYKAIETALQAAKGERLPEFIDTGFYWYDKSSIDSPEIQKYLYE